MSKPHCKKSYHNLSSHEILNNCLPIFTVYYVKNLWNNRSDFFGKKIEDYYITERNKFQKLYKFCEFLKLVDDQEHEIYLNEESFSLYKQLKEVKFDKIFK